MKTKMIGIIILLLVIVAGGGYYFYQNQTKVTSLNGYLGGEKIGLFEDEEVKDIVKKKYHVELSYSKSGSLDMVTADQTGRDYLFPSSQTALEYYEETYGKAVADEIIFNTPIVLYTHKIVADALVGEGIVTQSEGVYYADMQKLTGLILSGTSWNDIGLSQLYGSVSVDTTDPARSNSGNMFAALLANVLNGGRTVGTEEIDTILPQLKEIFVRLGYMETSSSDLFNQFLRMGVGAKPIIAGYESQLLEYAAEHPEEYGKIKDDVIIMYPSPTVWSTHIYIALDNEGKKGIEALSDDEVQRLAWEKHGFRTSSYNITSDTQEGQVQGIPQQLTYVVNMPEYAVMKKIIETLQ
ncbi:MAG: hypothetical protein Q4C57_04610 [Bacillota bacterium]|nr:hypothetical protein [Bacillota bacterium]